MPSPSRLGAGLILVGLAGFILTVFDLIPAEPGAGAAVSLFLVLVGLVFHFPTLLSDDTDRTSTMRVSVLMIVSVFLLLTLKVGWGATTLEELHLSESWIWVLAAAMGGKAFQSFAENAGSDGAAGSGGKKGGKKNDEKDD